MNSTYRPSTADFLAYGDEFYPVPWEDDVNDPPVTYIVDDVHSADAGHVDCRECERLPLGSVTIVVKRGPAYANTDTASFTMPGGNAVTIAV